MSYSIHGFEKIGSNFYKTGAGYWRLFGRGITPNGCWIISPKMVELKDINISTGKDVYGEAEVEFEFIGSVQSGPEYIRY